MNVLYMGAYFIIVFANGVCLFVSAFPPLLTIFETRFYNYESQNYTAAHFLNIAFVSK